MNLQYIIWSLEIFCIRNERFCFGPFFSRTDGWLNGARAACEKWRGREKWPGPHLNRQPIDLELNILLLCQSAILHTVAMVMSWQWASLGQAVCMQTSRWKGKCARLDLNQQTRCPAADCTTTKPHRFLCVCLEHLFDWHRAWSYYLGYKDVVLEAVLSCSPHIDLQI